ncbi:MAG TPA: GNAT family N-acetyltransferase [Pyrinomonadaceae bacterium]|nr:GNAT family N-acetyltransferase [Pyrinomonadaceae bacterium]
MLETSRLILRHFMPDDAAFIMELLNEPGWKRFIGDRNINAQDDARKYIEKLRVSYRDHGFGLCAVQLKVDETLIGMCGLIKRETLEDADIGFALLSRFEGNGYAREAAKATLEYAHVDLGLPRVVAITTEDNERSARLLEGIGLRYEETISMRGDPEMLRLYGISF